MVVLIFYLHDLMSVASMVMFPSQVRGTMSPDGAFVVCGSETGELLFWGRDGKPLLPPAVPQALGQVA